jgi:hypothetical protein
MLKGLTYTAQLSQPCVAGIDFALSFTLGGFPLALRWDSSIEYRPLRAATAPVAGGKSRVFGVVGVWD